MGFPKAQTIEHVEDVNNLANRVAYLEDKIEEMRRTSIRIDGPLDWLVFHPFRHFAAPGFCTKGEALGGIAWRALAGYGIYKAGAWAVGRIWG